MDTPQRRITPKEAVALGFSEFENLFDRKSLKHVLLEGLELVEETDQWRVTIGFDSGSFKEYSAPFVVQGLGEKTKEPIRAFRSVYLRADDGRFVRMERD